jgi:hypothetical protein
MAVLSTEEIIWQPDDAPSKVTSNPNDVEAKRREFKDFDRFIKPAQSAKKTNRRTTRSHRVACPTSSRPQMVVKDKYGPL